jgi:predicted TIM-barrel fold metal-dependent hydrolase
MRLAYDPVGPDRLLFASDQPWVDPALDEERDRQSEHPELRCVDRSGGFSSGNA